MGSILLGINKRNCPECRRELFYSRSWSCLAATRDNRRCRACRIFSLDTRKKMSESHRGEKNPMYKIGKEHPLYGKHHTIETRQKMRIGTLKRIENRHGIIFPNYNPSACKLIEEYGKQHGYKFQHAENGGEFHIKELGYWVDGYDKDKNVVIEVYEPFHERTKEKDLQRQKEIIKQLGCKFIIL